MIEKESYAPLIIFSYNRPKHLSSLLKSLSELSGAANTDLYLYSDGPKSVTDSFAVNTVRSVLKAFSGSKVFNSVTNFETPINKGLAQSVIDGVTDVISRYGKAIVLEDDLIVSKDFLSYMNSALSFYEHNDTIWAISGYTIPLKVASESGKDVYFSGRACSWGWATWANRWRKVDWGVSDYNSFRYNIKKRHDFGKWGADMPDMLDRYMLGEISSWAIRWCYAAWKNQMYTVYPTESFVINSGTDGTGTNFKSIEHRFDTKLLSKKSEFYFPDLYIDKNIRKEFKTHFTPAHLWIKIHFRVIINSFKKPSIKKR